jgi:hypothetical protein
MVNKTIIINSLKRLLDANKITQEQYDEAIVKLK